MKAEQWVEKLIAIFSF